MISEKAKELLEELINTIIFETQDGHNFHFDQVNPIFYKKLIDYIEQLEQQNEDLKCCGNCDNYLNDHGKCSVDNMHVEPQCCCERWKFDNMNSVGRK